MNSFEEEKQRRVSRVLTIDEIINPGGRNIPSPSIVSSGGKEVTHVVNPNANHFLRLNQSQVLYSPGIPITIPADHVDTHQQQQPRFDHGSKKSVSFAGSTSSNITNTTGPSVR